MSSEPFAEHGGRAIGVAAFFDEPVARDALVARVAEVTSREPLVFPEGRDPVRSIGIVSGAAPDDVHAAIARGLDAFLTGEPAERVAAIARESGMTFIAAGHHATERFGVRRLGEHLAARFDVRQTFADVPNPI